MKNGVFWKVLLYIILILFREPHTFAKAYICTVVYLNFPHLNVMPPSVIPCMYVYIYFIPFHRPTKPVTLWHRLTWARAQIYRFNLAHKYICLNCARLSGRHVIVYIIVAGSPCDLSGWGNSNANIFPSESPLPFHFEKTLRLKQLEALAGGRVRGGRERKRKKKAFGWRFSLLLLCQTMTRVRTNDGDDPYQRNDHLCVFILFFFVQKM